MACTDHYYCNCGRYENYRQCHYCRKKKNFYRAHFICVDCRIAWKSNYEFELVPDAEGAQLYKMPPAWARYGLPKCSKCQKYGVEVGRDFRVPKHKDHKAWKSLAEIRDSFKTCNDNDFAFGLYMKDKYRYNCGGGYFSYKTPKLYEEREKKPLY